jgi:hypothetical protein
MELLGSFRNLAKSQRKGAEQIFKNTTGFPYPADEPRGLYAKPGASSKPKGNISSEN